MGSAREALKTVALGPPARRAFLAGQRPPMPAHTLALLGGNRGACEPRQGRPHNLTMTACTHVVVLSARELKERQIEIAVRIEQHQNGEGWPMGYSPRCC